MKQLRLAILRLQPKPEILGFVPNQYDRRVAIHRTMLDELNPMLDNIGIQCFPPIRYSTEFKNASSQGIPLNLFRPTNPACNDFTPIMKALQKLINQLKEEKEWVLNEMEKTELEAFEKALKEKLKEIRTNFKN